MIDFLRCPHVVIAKLLNNLGIGVYENFVMVGACLFATHGSLCLKNFHPVNFFRNNGNDFNLQST